jgi:glucose 1-dehydrogenase
MGRVTLDFSDDVAFVTGAAGGMGRAIVTAFVVAGAKVIATDVDGFRGAEAVAMANAAGPGEARYVHCDVATGESVAAAVGEAVRRWGKLTCAVNAAAIENETLPLHELPDGAFEEMQSVNVSGIFLCLKHEIAAMLAGEGGAIVNIASTNSFKPQPTQTAYTASKHAVLGITRAAAVDYGRKGIRINAICPGSIDTPMLRNAIARRGRDPKDVVSRLSLIGRFGTPEEIASAALWLCSDGSSYVYGHPLLVDGGLLLL